MSLIKDQLRKEIRLKSSTYRCKEKEEKIAEHLIESPLFIEADTVFLYAALKSEISVDKIATRIGYIEKRKEQERDETNEKNHNSSSSGGPGEDGR